MPDKPASLGDPGTGDSCRVCRSPLSSSSGRCGDCGSVHGEGFRCPHCGAVADTDPHPVLRQRCRVCGGPRVPAEGLAERSGTESRALSRAARARSASLAWRLAAIMVMSFGLIGLIVTLGVVAVADLGVLSSLLMLFLVASPPIGALLAWRQATWHRKELRGALDEAWSNVAEELLVRNDRELTAEQLAQELHTTPDQSEALLARLGAEDRVRMRVTDEGQLLFGLGASPRIRVGMEHSPTELMAIDEVVEAEQASRTNEEE